MFLCGDIHLRQACLCDELQAQLSIHRRNGGVARGNAQAKHPPLKNKVENRYGWKPRPLFLDNYSKGYN